MPVNGRIKRESSNKVLILGEGGSFRDNEIVIDKFNVDETISNQFKFIEAGETIGVGKESDCGLPYIHVSMRFKSGKNSDKHKKYMDPTKFLTFRVPIPKWKEHCRDFEFHILGGVSDVGNLGNGFQEVARKFKRITKDKIKKGYKDLKDKVNKELNEIPKKNVDDIYQSDPNFDFDAEGTEKKLDFPAMENIFADFGQLFEEGPG